MGVANNNFYWETCKPNFYLAIYLLKLAQDISRDDLSEYRNSPAKTQMNMHYNLAAALTFRVITLEDVLGLIIFDKLQPIAKSKDGILYSKIGSLILTPINFVHKGYEIFK